MVQPDGPWLVREAYGALVDVLQGLDEDGSWRPTGCTGWAVRDLTFHCLADAQRALVALHTPTSAEVDRDAVTYWRDWAPDPVASAQGRRYARVGGSMFLHWTDLREAYTGTAEAVVQAAAVEEPTAPSRRVRTQGHVLTVEDLLSTLCVEATIHHLDLVADLPDARPPAPAGLAEVRRVLDGLVGGPLDVAWGDDRYARVATGRARPTAEEQRALGDVVDRFPVFS